MSHNISYSNAKASENLTILCDTGVAQYRLNKRPEIFEYFALTEDHDTRYAFFVPLPTSSHNKSNFCFSASAIVSLSITTVTISSTPLTMTTLWS